MTVYSQIEANRTYFSGLSSDTKPTSTVQPGAIFIETDTLNQFIYTSAGTWVAYYEKEALLDGYGNPIGSTNGILLTASYIWQPSTLSFIHASADSNGNLNVTTQGAIANVGNVIVTSGNITLTAGTANIGNVNSYQGGAWDVTGNVSIKSSTNNIGNVNVNNFPAIQAVSGAVTIAPGSNAIGNVVISNFPSTQTINGSVTVVSSNAANLLANVTVTNFPTSQTVSGAVTLAAGSNAIGNVVVSNFPSTQTVNGSVTVVSSNSANLLANVTVTNFPSTQTVNGTVTVVSSNSANLLANVTVTNFPATQNVAVTGNVSTTVTTNPLTPSNSVVTTASSQILASNANRKGLVIINTGSYTVSLGFSNVAVANSGVVLYPSGTFHMDAYSFTTSNVTAIATTANSYVGIQEWQ